MFIIIIIIIIILSMPKWHMRPLFKVSVTIICFTGQGC